MAGLKVECSSAEFSSFIEFLNCGAKQNQSLLKHRHFPILLPLPWWHCGPLLAYASAANHFHRLIPSHHIILTHLLDLMPLPASELGLVHTSRSQSNYPAEIPKGDLSLQSLSARTVCTSLSPLDPAGLPEKWQLRKPRRLPPLLPPGPRL